MKNEILGKKERETIFELFTRHKILKFSDIEKEVRLRSNHLSYHITKLLKENILEKEGDYYKLTIEAEKSIPSFAHITGKEQGPVSIITAAIINKNKICLLKRNKRPYQGYWGLIGGKLKLHESVKETALRESKEETDLNCKFDRLCAVLHERVKENSEVKHAFIIYFCRLLTSESQTKQTEEGELCWFNLRKLPENIIPSDRYMITKLLNKKFSCKNLIVEDKNGEFVNMGVEDSGRI